jgi:hypothetical protein
MSLHGIMQSPVSELLKKDELEMMRKDAAVS